MIRVLLFAELGEVVGQKELSIDLEEATISEVKQKLSQQFPTLELGHVMVAINEEYAQDDTKVKLGDVIAFIPPVSGG